MTTMDFDTEMQRVLTLRRCTLGFRCGCARCFATIEVPGRGEGLVSHLRSQSSKRRFNTCNGKTKSNLQFFRDLAEAGIPWI